MSELNNDPTGILIIDCGTITALPVTITDSRIKSNHVLIGVEMTNIQGVAGDWIVTTNDGSLSISGLVVVVPVGIKLYLVESEV